MKEISQLLKKRDLKRYYAQTLLANIQKSIPHKAMHKTIHLALREVSIKNIDKIILASMVKLIEKALLASDEHPRQNNVLKSLVPPKKISRGKALLIENHPLLIKAHWILLSQMGFTVDIASKKEDLDKCAKHKYRAIFTCLSKDKFNAWLGARMYFCSQDTIGPKIFLLLEPQQNDEYRDYFLYQQTYHIFDLPLTREKVEPILNKFLPLLDKPSI